MNRAIDTATTPVANWRPANKVIFPFDLVCKPWLRPNGAESFAISAAFHRVESLPLLSPAGLTWLDPRVHGTPGPPRDDGSDSVNLSA
jgi:hypothetical protein